MYNDAKFSNRDWKGLRLLQASIKQNDPMKIGRFGLGFKSVFHMTGKASYMHIVITIRKNLYGTMYSMQCNEWLAYVIVTNRSRLTYSSNSYFSQLTGLYE